MVKQSLRRKLKNERDLISGEVRNRISSFVCSTIASTDEYACADTVLLYYPIGSEINLLPLAELAHNQGKKLAFPNINNNQMCFYSVTSLDSFANDDYGIPSPRTESSEIVSDYCNSICVVPALAVDFNGNRIGYGGGYYDRFLLNYSGFSVAAVYPQFYLEKIPTENHDIKVNAAAILPIGVKRFK